jgi:hypothetical protein
LKKKNHSKSIEELVKDHQTKEESSVFQGTFDQRAFAKKEE